MDPTFIHGGTEDSELYPPTSDERPPYLAALDPSPRYDLGTVVQRLGVNRMVLLAWEQQLGMPVTGRLGDERERTRRYSERDFQALAWIRDRCMEGTPQSEAIARLLAAQGTLPPRGSAPLSGDLGAAVPVLPYRPRINTQPLAGSTFGFPPQAAQQMQPNQPGARHPGSSARHVVPPALRPEGNAGGASGPLAFAEVAELAEAVHARRIPGTGRADLRAFAQPLLRAFGSLDTRSANAILSEALGVSSLEAVCVALLQPVLNRIDELWAHRQMTMPEQRFALNYIRAFLFSQFQTTVERPGAPTAFVGCGPREHNDLPALTLAVFWRRAGLRVIYLGQDVIGPELVEQARMRKPDLAALLICEPQRMRSLSRIARALQQTPPQRPIFAFGGPIFARNPELQRKVSGVYLGDDAMAATWHVRRLLGLGRPAQEQS